MVFVKVRETYDLHTLRNKMTVIGIHTPKPSIIKRNYPGLLMQCKAYRPVKADVRLACASMLPLDPQGVGLTEGDVAPEDVFNPILYKAVSNLSMSQIESLIQILGNGVTGVPASTDGDSVLSTNDGLTSDDFNIYYGLLSDTNGWKHASPQAGLNMSGLVPLVYEMYTNIGENQVAFSSDGSAEQSGITPDNGVVYGMKPAGTISTMMDSNIRLGRTFRGKAHPIPMMNTTSFLPAATASDGANISHLAAGFNEVSGSANPNNWQIGVPAPRVFCGLIIVPPSRLHQLFYRLVCEWTLEFSSIRSFSEITSFSGLGVIGDATHWQDYDFGESKVMSEETDLVSTSEESGIHKVM